MKNLYLIGGAPGAGKTTLANVLMDGYYPKHSTKHFEADMFFTHHGEYNFDRTKLQDAHAWCQQQVVEAMCSFDPVIIVSNTFTKAWERKPYLDMARKYGYTVHYIYCTGTFDNVHGVPHEVVERMRQTYEPFDPAKEL